MTPIVFQQLREFDTALLANTIGYIDATPIHEIYMSGEIQSVTPSLGPTVGIAFTCELDSSTPGNTANLDLYWEQLEQMAACPLPIVWVVKTIGARPDHECVIGDGMAKTLYSVGCQGLVTNGRVRDISGLLTVPFAVYCRGKSIHHVALRVQSINQPVEVGGITIHSGEIIHANSEGVIKIPLRAAEKLPESAVRMRAFEHKAHLILRQPDIRLADKRKRVQELVSEYGFADCTSTINRDHSGRNS